MTENVTANEQKIKLHDRELEHLELSKECNRNKTNYELIKNIQ